MYSFLLRKGRKKDGGDAGESGSSDGGNLSYDSMRSKESFEYVPISGSEDGSEEGGHCPVDKKGRRKKAVESGSESDKGGGVGKAGGAKRKSGPDPGPLTLVDAKKAKKAAAASEICGFGHMMAVREKRADPGGWPHLWSALGSVRTSQNVDSSWDFRATCYECGATKSATCRPAAASASRFRRGQGRPGGLMFSFLNCSEVLAAGHSKDAHNLAFASYLTQASRKIGRRQFEVETRHVEHWYPPRPATWPLERAPDSDFDDSDDEPNPLHPKSSKKAAAAKAVPAAKAKPGGLTIAHPKAKAAKASKK